VDGIHEVTGSIPVSSTNFGNNLRKWPQPLKARRVRGGSVFAAAAQNSLEARQPETPRQVFAGKTAGGGEARPGHKRERECRR
jgi:hypothetical protein